MQSTFNVKLSLRPKDNARTKPRREVGVSLPREKLGSPALKGRGKENYNPYTLILIFASMIVIHMVMFISSINLLPTLSNSFLVSHSEWMPTVLKRP